MIEFILILFIGAFCLLGWIVGSIKEAKEKRERANKASIIRMGISSVYSKYPRAFYSKFKKHYSELDEWDLLKAGDIPDHEWQILENSELKKEADKFYDNWQKKHKAYSEASRDAVPKNWGCYKYSFSVCNHLIKSKSYQFTIWNHFCEAFHTDPSLDYSTRSKVQANIKVANNLKSCQTFFYERVYDTVYELINQFKDKVTILVADSEVGDFADTFNDYHLNYLKEKLGNTIDWMTIDEYLNMDRHWPTYLIILEVVTSPQSLINNCNKILNLPRNWNVTYGSGYPHLPHVPIHSTLTAPVITYISLMKEYTHDEIQAIIDYDHKILEERRKAEEEKARLKALEEQEKERVRLENERIERERIKQEKEEAERRETAHLRLRNSLGSWYIPNHSKLKCFSMYYYYPTNCDFEVSQFDWDVRNLIWDFKANPNKPMDEDTIMELHSNAADEIIDDMIHCLNHFFKEDVKYLTLACVPSSKEIVNKRRFKDFSHKLCERTGMNNGFAHIRVTCDGDAKHLGGLNTSQYEVDTDFFTGKNVLLFDDVITSGKSMEKLRIVLEKAGANVIGGFSVGKTKHEKQNNHPYFMLSKSQQIGTSPLDDLPF